MPLSRLLIANRGEIAVRIAAAAAELGVASVAVFAEDDAQALHRFKADVAVPLRGQGPAAYLDADQIVRVAQENGCDAVHPGYGFLSENPDFARRCAAAGLTFVGPPAAVLEQFADKAQARALAQRAGVPVLPGSAAAVTPAEAQAFLASLGDGAAVMLKAVAGGGGRGIRRVDQVEQIAEAYRECQAEALQAFGDGRLLVEQFIPRARHLEIQVVADAEGHVIHLGERECSVQRRRQKLVEMAPCPDLPGPLRERLAEAALRMARAAGYVNLGTFEFLVDADPLRDAAGAARFVFMEVNPRLQVEHTVTEEVMHVDLVRTQLQIAGGARLDALGLTQARFAQADGLALQARVNLETVGADGSVSPAVGRLAVFEMAAGRGVRVDGAGYAGYAPSPRYDSLLAKLVVHSPQPDVRALLRKAERALADCRIEGIDTNLPLLRALVRRPELADGRVHTRWLDEVVGELMVDAATTPRARPPGVDGTVASAGGSAVAKRPPGPPESLPAAAHVVDAEMPGLVVEVLVASGDRVLAGQTLAVLEAMKMVHAVVAPADGVVRWVGLAAGEVVQLQQPLLAIEPGGDGAADAARRSDDEAADDGHRLRPDLAEILERKRLGLDAQRPQAVERRHAAGQRTARENVADLCDDGSFVEYGALAIASQRRRRPLDDLIRQTPADGIVTGIGQVNATHFGAAASRCAVLAYDYTVLAGTQGHQTHRKMDRLLELAERDRLPVVLFAEGGGGRPGDVDVTTVAGLDVPAFYLMARLSGWVPLVGIASGYCFAGNAALLGCCDVIIATEGASIGMGGPAMIEGGGLGVVHPRDVGPMSVQVPNGVVDIAVADEAQAVAVAKQVLAYFQGPLSTWQAPDPMPLRRSIPEDRRRTYPVRAVVEGLADVGSVLELRSAYGRGIVTALARVEGRPVGVLANDPRHLGGAIDGPSADKAARFMQLCDAHDIPLLSLCDTPGFMVGPESEKTAVVRRFARLFVTGASLSTPLLAVVLRKAYGLGAMAMMGGHAKRPQLTVSWPSGEFGGMGIEGAVRLGLRKELEAIADPVEREATFRQHVAAAYDFGKAANTASLFEVDDVIDPAETRRILAAALCARAAPPPRSGKKRNHVDPW